MKTEQEIKQLQQLTNEQVRQVDNLKIKNTKDLEVAKEQLKKLAQVKKEIDSKKTAITKPMNNALKAIRELFKPLETELSTADHNLRSKMYDYNEAVKREMEKKSQEVARQIAKEQEAGKDTTNILEKAEKKMASVIAKQEAIPTRKVKKVIITNENLVPRQYLEMNMVAIRRDALAGIEIAGVQVIEEEVIVIK